MIVIVGAGPAGLATARALQRRGLPARLLEQGKVGETWRHQYDRLHLHTLKALSALPDLPMPADYPRFPSAAQFSAYLEGYAAHFGLDVATGVQVHHAAPTPDGWWLATSAGDLAAEVLVLATGIWHTPYRPTLGGEAKFGGPILHSRDYRNPAPFRGQRVLVVGAGNSGSEIAVDLCAAGVETTIAIRSGATFAPRPRSVLRMRAAGWLFRHLPRPVGELLLRLARRDPHGSGIPAPSGWLIDAFPVVGDDLPAAVAAGEIRCVGGVARLVPGGVRFDDGHEAPFDAVILATGFRPTIGFVAGGLRLDAQGRPEVDGQWRSVGNERLFCVGFWYPTTEGWLQAIGRVADAAAAGIAATVSAAERVGA